MNKQELIERIENMPYESGILMDFVKINRWWLLKTIKQLEPEKVKIPQFVADWIEVAKTVYSLSGGMTYGGPGVNKWLENEDNQRTFALAWLDGYKVEEEPKYIVKMKGTGQCLEKTTSVISFSALFKSDFTRKELEDAGFGWVFDCEGVEVEEV